MKSISLISLIFILTSMQCIRVVNMHPTFKIKNKTNDTLVIDKSVAIEYTNGFNMDTCYLDSAIKILPKAKYFACYTESCFLSNKALPVMVYYKRNGVRDSFLLPAIERRDNGFYKSIDAKIIIE